MQGWRASWRRQPWGPTEQVGVQGQLRPSPSLDWKASWPFLQEALLAPRSLTRVAIRRHASLPSQGAREGCEELAWPCVCPECAWALGISGRPGTGTVCCDGGERCRELGAGLALPWSQPCGAQDTAAPSLGPLAGPCPGARRGQSEMTCLLRPLGGTRCAGK